jgi:hypothetical protein
VKTSQIDRNAQGPVSGLMPAFAHAFTKGCLGDARLDRSEVTSPPGEGSA